jgi:activator of HSP90 ATPase
MGNALMLKVIEQSVTFPATASRLFQIYIDEKKHAAMTGAPVHLDPRPGGTFSAFGGQLAGATLYVVPNRLIVQRWRSTGWKKSDLDSTLILSFHKQGKRGRIDLVHVNVPDHDFDGVTRGWETYYWTPLRAYLK